MKEIYLIDGMSMVFRAFHAMFKSGLKSPEGMPTGAIFGFSNILTKLIEERKPTDLAVVFDTSAPTFRSELYADYKGNREDFPEELAPQLPKIKELIDYLGIARIEKDGYEADDIIGTLAADGSKRGYKVYCVTNDKDFMQLIDANVKILKPQKNDEMQLIDYEQVKEKFGVAPTQVIDVQALIGDAVDNVPGIKGIGEKTAGPLIHTYGNLENLLANIDKITQKAVRMKLREGQAIAKLSKTLVTIKLDCELDFTADDLEMNTPKYAELDKFFGEVGFKTLRKKWSDKARANNVEIVSEYSEKEYEKFESIARDYKLLNDLSEIDTLVKSIESAGFVAFDLETDSLDIHTCNIVGIALSKAENQGYYIPVSSIHSNRNVDLFSVQEEHQTKSLDAMEVIEKLRGVLTNQSIEKYGQNAKFDAYILKRYGLDVSPISFDTMIASFILNPDTAHNLDALSEEYLNYKPISITTLIGEKKAGQKSMADLDPMEIKDYAAEDADLVIKLVPHLKKKIEEEGLQKLAYEVEFPIIEILRDMEFIGVKIDTDALKEISKEIDLEVIELKEKIFSEAGVEFNIDSPKQLGHILFEKLMLPTQKKTKTGYSTDSSVLTELAKTYPIASLIENYRQLVKLNSTYVTALPKLINKETGRIHTTYNQAVAATGRLSSTNPNLQNIPIKTDYGKRIRKVFVAGFDDHVILSADYSQIELRIMAHISNDQPLIDAFKNGLDVHSETAVKIFNKRREDVNQDDRRIAKTVNFGIMYGLGSFGLAQRLDLSRPFAKQIIDSYFESYPGIKKYMDMTIESTKKKGYAETLYGRRRYFPNINSNNRNIAAQDERASINMPIQGTASDMIKLAMIKIHNRIKSEKLNTKMIMQVHDELVFEVPKNELEYAQKFIQEEMQNALPLGEVPVLVEYGSGLNWFAAH